MEYHLRVSVKLEHAEGVMKDFITAFKPKEYVCCYENKGDDKNEEVNPHIHCYLKYDKEPSKQKVSEFMKRQPILKNETVAGYYHRKQTKTTDENIVYTIKGRHYIVKNIDVSSAELKTECINQDKKLSSREKLYKRYVLKNGINYPMSKYMLFEFIDDVYIFEFKKSPPNNSQLAMYSRFILKMIHSEVNKKNDDLFKLLLLNIYGIRDHLELVHDTNRKEAEAYTRRNYNEVINCDFIDE